MIRDLKVCPVWMAYIFDNPIRKYLHDPKELFGKYIEVGMSVLDMGCGLGHFSLGLADMVGLEGKVYAVDLQQDMLDQVKKRALRKGFNKVILTHKCSSNNIDLDHSFEFINCFWMIHETPDPLLLFHRLSELMQPGGHLFLADPKVHVAKRDFEKIVASALRQDLILYARPQVKLSYAAVFKKPLQDNLEMETRYGFIQ